MDKVYTNWKTIEDAPNYEVSNYGDIRNKTTQIVLKGTVNSEGYLMVTLYNKGEKVPKAIHRVVGQYHVDNPYGYNVLNHKKGIKTDNRAWELEWGTTAHNNTHALETGLRKLYRDGKDNANKKIINTITGEQYSSIKEAAKDMKIKYTSLRRMLRGIQKNKSNLDYL